MKKVHIKTKNTFYFFHLYFKSIEFLMFLLQPKKFLD